MPNIPITISNPNNSFEFYRKCLINFGGTSRTRLPFESVKTEIENTWGEISEKINFKTWSEIETMFNISTGIENSLQAIIAIKVTNTHLMDLKKIKIEWLPYEGTNRQKLSDLNSNILVYLFPKEIVYNQIRSDNLNPSILGLCARLAKVENNWVLYLMTYANQNDTPDTKFTILYPSISHAGGGNSGVRIPPLADE